MKDTLRQLLWILSLSFLSPRVQGLLRHSLTAVGMLFVERGYSTEEDVGLYVGIVIILMSFIASWAAPEKRQ